MFGVLRTTLAIMVMSYHLFFGILPLGVYAVFGFYIISGYLMTLIMHESYGYTPFGRISFAANRFLRLYPQYWAAALFSIALIVSFGAKNAARYHRSIFIPDSLSSMMHNLLMLFPSWYPNSIQPRLVPPTWALTVEIFFYILICLGISKSFNRVKIWFLLSVCYVIGSYVMDLSWKARYFPVAAASLPFSIGSAIYFFSKNRALQNLLSRLKFSSLPLFVLMLINCFAWTVLFKVGIGKIVEVGFYLNILLCSLLVYSIVNGSEIFNIKKKTDKLIGDFSYPVYLLHWQCGLLISFLIFGKSFHEFSPKGFISFLVSSILVFIVSFIFISLIDKPVQQVRGVIKANKNLRRQIIPGAKEI